MYQQADWERMRELITDTDWSFLESGDVHAGAKRLIEIILKAADECIPTKVLREKSAIDGVQSFHIEERHSNTEHEARRKSMVVEDAQAARRQG